MLERDSAQVNLDAISDEELDAYAKSVEFGSPECWAAVLTKVQRQATTIKVVPDEQEIWSPKPKFDWR